MSIQDKTAAQYGGGRVFLEAHDEDTGADNGLVGLIHHDSRCIAVPSSGRVMSHHGCTATRRTRQRTAEPQSHPTP